MSSNTSVPNRMSRVDENTSMKKKQKLNSSSSEENLAGGTKSMSLSQSHQQLQAQQQGMEKRPNFSVNGGVGLKLSNHNSASKPGDKKTLVIKNFISKLWSNTLFCVQGCGNRS